jgi:hypothetical protein
LGSALALKNGWLAVGAPRDDTAAAQAGAVHLYERVSGTNGITYIHRQTLTPPVAQNEARFGASVSLTDSHLIIGAPGVDISDQQDGQVFIYEKRETNWTKIGEVFALTATQGEFGIGVLATTNSIFASCNSSKPSALLHERIRILHYLIVDDRLTWWEMGRSYLCRIVDMLHAGFVDEVLFGREVLTRWPVIVRSWPDPKIGYPQGECVPPS